MRTGAVQVRACSPITAAFVLSQLLIACAVLCLVAPPAEAGIPEHEGTGEVQVVGGNLVSARRRALRHARRDAVARAVASRVPAGKLAELQVKLKSSIYRRASRYIRTYRVLEETHQGRLFRIKVAVVVNTKRLHGDLGKLLGTSTSPGTAKGVKAKVGVWLEVKHVADRAAMSALRARITSTLDAAGYTAVALQKPGTQWSSQARAQGAAFVLKVSMEMAAAKGIRGLALAGAKGTATLWLGMVATSSKLIETSVEGWGAAAKPKDARREAAHSALARGLANVLATLKGRLHPGQIAAGQRVIHLSGLSSFEQYRRITRALQEQISGVVRCDLRRMGPGEVWYAVQTSHSARHLATELERRTFGKFVVKTKNIVGGSVWMTVEPVVTAAP